MKARTLMKRHAIQLRYLVGVTTILLILQVWELITR